MLRFLYVCPGFLIDGVWVSLPVFQLVLLMVGPQKCDDLFGVDDPDEPSVVIDDG